MSKKKPIRAVIQAGGKGTRLQPYTMVLPKPLLPVNGMPVIELLLKWLRKAGITHTYITTGYLSHLIKTICGTGEQWDMRIEYSEEREPRGTIGPLRLLGPEKLDETFLVLNGDVITDLNLRELVESHRKSGAMVSVAVTKKNIHIDLGVLEYKDNRLTAFREKPTLEYNVSMGIYCMEPEILRYIPSNVPYGFDDLMYHLLDNDLQVNIYEHSGTWMDIGRPDDFLKVQKMMQDNPDIIMGF